MSLLRLYVRNSSVGGFTSVRVLFWNVSRRDLRDYVCQLAIEFAPDLIVLLENSISTAAMLSDLRERVSPSFYGPKFINANRFHVFCRCPELVPHEIHNDDRVSYWTLGRLPNEMIFGFVHGPDKRNYDDAARQEWAIRVAHETDWVKRTYQNSQIILMGDFNMNPFERGMDLASGFNSVSTKLCASPKGRVLSRRKYDFFYNPMWSFFGDLSRGPPGTFYDVSNQGSYGWNMLDQVLISSNLVKRFMDVIIIENCGEIRLGTQLGRPNSRKISQHFPLLLELENGS